MVSSHQQTDFSSAKVGVTIPAGGWLPVHQHPDDPTLSVFCASCSAALLASCAVNQTLFAPPYWSSLGTMEIRDFAEAANSAKFGLRRKIQEIPRNAAKIVKFEEFV